MRKISSSSLFLALFLLLVFGGSYYLSGGLPPTSLRNPKIITPTPHSVIVAPTVIYNQNGLQIGTIPTILPTDTPAPQPTTPERQAPPPPPPSNACAHWQPITAACPCNDGTPMSSCGGIDAVTCNGQGGSPAQGNCLFPDPNRAGCTAICAEKPVIYLYPITPTRISVTLTIPGRIVKSDPSYPINGWQNMTAEPNGTLLYNGKQYTELFYESAINRKPNFTNSSVYSMSGIRKTLINITTQLGLQGNEQAEFLAYWLERLQTINTPYVSISLLVGEEKDAIDTVTVSPKPNTFIGFLLYFKPSLLPISFTKPLTLPQTPPLRNGFTVVEWGGGILSAE